MTIPVVVDYQQPFSGSDHVAWEKEYKANILVAADPRWAWENDLPGHAATAARWPFESDNEAFEYELAVAGYIGDCDDLLTEEE